MPQIIYVLICKCGNPDCSEEALGERCRYYREQHGSTLEDQREVKTAEWGEYESD